MNPPGTAELQLGTKKSGTAELQLGINNPEWYSRGYLPHRDKISLLQAITFRLADSLPQNILSQMQQELTNIAPENHDIERRKKIEQWLDSGMGCCALKHPAMAEITQNALLKFDGEKYHLIAWVIMPTHLHVLIEPFIAIGKIVQSWKSFTGRWALKHNAELKLGIPGEHFWMREYWDRFIRDKQHLNAVIKYIHNNPVKAGLCSVATEWEWSSASVKEGAELEESKGAELELSGPRGEGKKREPSWSSAVPGGGE